jgi:hypothetical protein
MPLAGQQRGLSWRVCASGLRIKKQRNNIPSCDLVIDGEKVDLSKIQVGPKMLAVEMISRTSRGGPSIY